MNRNKKLRKKMMAELAAGMAGIMGTMPVYASDRETKVAKVTKEETVYVNAEADGSESKITVSDWLKNAGLEKVLEDESELHGIRNVKGDETFQENGNQVTWQTEGKDIYYQGTAEKELPVSVKFTYYLDGKETKPEELKGKSGHLKIRIDYENHAEVKTEIDGKEETVCSPFVMVTGLILPDETFSNVVIDNGKVISDGQRNIVLGVAVPGLADSLGIAGGEAEELTGDFTLPESLEITADVQDFQMDSTFTAATPDLLQDFDLGDAGMADTLESSLDGLEDAALQLVSGSSELFQGADELNRGIRQYLGTDGELPKKVTEYVNGVNKVVKGVRDYAEGTDALADGITEYVKGGEQLAKGAEQLSELKSGISGVKAAVTELADVLDGEGGTEKDIRAASGALAEGTRKLSDSLSSMEALMDQTDEMAAAGKELAGKAGVLSETAEVEILEPARKMMETGNAVMKNLQDIYGQLATVYQSAAASSAQIDRAVSELNTQTAKAKEEGDAALAEELQRVVSELQNAKTDIRKPDLGSLKEMLEEMQQQFTGIQKSMGKISPQIQELEQGMEDVSAMKDKIPQQPVQQLFAGVKTLDQGMQSLNGAIVSLSENTAKLDKETDALPEAAEGLDALNEGLAQLSGAGGELAFGAAKLKANSPSLVSGVETLSGGTKELSGGILTLGKELTSGSQTLLDGAGQLKDGTLKFNEDGVKKLQTAAKDLLGAAADRLDALTSEECSYDTFSGKPEQMEGSVKFVIETEAVK